MTVMEAEASMAGAGSSEGMGKPVVTGAQLPLAMVSKGETIRVLKVRGGASLRQHLSEMGFVEGAEVKVVSRVNGDVVVNVKGATFGIGRDMAMKIVTC
ncbi:ferrous iron transport protein A [Olsenella sp. Marseille-P4559]|uniref:FeoA family protein n=1 Tax=Olsenella sp. Marseille-P4559 TaxID=2364795 RepID=UPI00352FC80F